VSFEQDHFSAKAAVYARRRPTYPDALYDALTAAAPGHGLAWDCGTGNGQAAVALARRFDRVLATDASRQQLAHRFEHARASYAAARAEHAPLREGSADLVTVAAAVHWFDLDAFYAEVLRVLRPGGVLAVWTYFESEVSPEFDAVLGRFAFETLKEDWPPGMRYPQAHYANLPFPLPPLDLPAFQCEAHWSLEEMRGFVETWSATQRRAARLGTDPLAPIAAALKDAWGAEETRRVVLPIHLRAGQKAG
jgi:SAM-dependent methyltransferase